MGGSFNPAHEGHLHISLLALDALRLHELWWLVSPQNPLKSEGEMLPLSTRLNTAKSIVNHPRILVTDIERQFGTRYTVDTLRELKRRFHGTRFVWVMGADNLVQIPQWRDWQQIFEEVPVAIFDRPSYAESAMNGEAARRYARRRVNSRHAPQLTDRKPPAWVFLHTPLNPASATEIRSRRTCRHRSAGDQDRRQN